MTASFCALLSLCPQQDLYACIHEFSGKVTKFMGNALKPDRRVGPECSLCLPFLQRHCAGTVYLCCVQYNVPPGHSKRAGGCVPVVLDLVLWLASKVLVIDQSICITGADYSQCGTRISYSHRSAYMHAACARVAKLRFGFW